MAEEGAARRHWARGGGVGVSGTPALGSGSGSASRGAPSTGWRPLRSLAKRATEPPTACRGHGFAKPTA